MLLVNSAILCLLTFPGVLGADWGYTGANGPSHWVKDYPLCGGGSQSPINVFEGGVTHDASLPDFLFDNYDTNTGLTMQLSNNGHTAVVSLGGTTQVSMSRGGLPGIYRAVQFHFHWGRNSQQGSEHLLSGQAFPMELHIVHYNSKYPSIGDAISNSDGLAVLGFMFEVSATANSNYDGLIAALASVKASGASIAVAPVPLNSLLPSTFENFYRYSGSLTTPQCQESVTWTVFQEPIKISEGQLEAFRLLLDDGEAPIVDNFRPTQPINNRQITANFKPDIHWTYFGSHGAEYWKDYYPSCGLDSQSPVNIPTLASQMNGTLIPLTYNNYDSTEGTAMRIKNNGHTVQVDITGGQLSISGGMLPETYIAAQFHFHWGSSATQGSEHTVDGRMYPMEVHIVHYRQSLGNLSAAATQPEGLAVLGFFFEVADGDNMALQTLVESLATVERAGTNAAIATMSLKSFLPVNKDDYYRYSGSLTTPGCYESVIWTVFAETIKISPNQLSAFRQLLSSDMNQDGTAYLPMVDNFRPIQDLNTRVVYRNFATQPATAKWTYKGSQGVENWFRDYPVCGSTSTSKQSPIDIRPTTVTYDNMDGIYFTNYNTVKDVTMKLKNNGHTVQVDIMGGAIFISGGGLGGNFKAAQFHFHWGSDNTRGSEHVVNGKSYPMELHIVHYNTIYPNLLTAATQPDGLAVLGFFFEISSTPNTNFDVLVDKLSDITRPDSMVTIPAMTLRSLLPANTEDFYRYQGSLTTPGCFESVTWTVFRAPIKISEEQLQKFRALKSSDIEPATNQPAFLVDNYRPPQPINTRVVRANFYIDQTGDSATLIRSSLLLLTISVVLALRRLA